MLLTGVFLEGYEPNAKVVSRLRCPWSCPTAPGAGSLLGTSELVHGGSPPATNAVIGPQNQVRGRRCLSRDSEAHSLAEIRKRRTNHNAMNIARVHLDALKALGYTDAEARFLYIVATHSGYFVARQFLAFANAHWGERTTIFWNKLHTKKHARPERFPKSGKVYQTEPQKVSFFCDQLKAPRHFLPSKIYHGQRTSQPTLGYFVDKFPMFLSGEASSPVVTFTYLQGPEASLTEFVRHLEVYLPLFRQLPEFRVLYLARVDSHFEEAKELFNALVAVPLGSDASAELLRYFQIQKAWDLGRYGSLTEADLIFRNQAKTQFTGQRFEHLYRGWKVGRVREFDILQEFGGTRHVIVHFATEVLHPVGLPMQEPKGKG